MRNFVLRALLLSPLYALYGAFLVVRAVLRAPRKLRALRAGLATELRCVEGHANPTTGRFVCASCRSEYVGWVGKCAVCGAGAAYLVCRCGLAIPLPWEGP